MNLFSPFGKRKSNRKRSSAGTKRLKYLRGKTLRYEPLEVRNLLSVSPVVLDNEGTHYQEAGENWSSWEDANALGQDFRYHAGGDGTASASWTFDTLTPGKDYQLYTSYVSSGNRASNAPFTVLDGANTLATVRLNQQFPPVDRSFAEHSWQTLGVYHTDTGSLTIRLTDDANAYVIADAVAAVEVPPVTVAPTVVDNADAAYAEEGTDWRGWNDPNAFGGGIRYHAPGTGENCATWTFETLDSTKSYQVVARWSANNNHSSNAPFTVFDDTTNLATVRVNQQFAPGDVALDGWNWQNLGTYRPTNGKLVVSLSDDANGYVIADAVRLVEVSPPVTPPALIDNADAGYGEEGTGWLSWSETGAYGNTFRYCAAGTGENVSRWTFEGLDPAKRFLVYCTWSAQSNRATNAPFTVLNDTTALATVRVNQQFAPNSATIDGRSWESLGAYQVTSGRLVVQLSDDASGGYVIADAVRLVEAPAMTASVVDNGDAAYTEQGDWLGWSESGAFQGSFRYHAAGTGQNSATWAFDHIDPTAEYEAFCTWNANPNRATNAPFTVLDGDNSLGTVRVNQQVAPGDLEFDGQGWKSLGIFQSTSGTLTVRLSDDANGYVIADGVRLRRVAAPLVSLGIADVTVMEDSPVEVIDLGSAFKNGDRPADELRYQVTGNTNPALFSSMETVNQIGKLMLTPGGNASGSAELTVRATNRRGLFAESSFTVTVEAVNDAPTAAEATTLLVRQNAAPTVLDLAAIFADADGVADSLSYDVRDNSNPGLIVPGVNQDQLALTYQPGVSGTAEIVIRATDSGGLTAEHTIEITVSATNLAPQVGGLTDEPDPTIEGAPLHLQAQGVIDDVEVASVSFWRDADKNGLFDAATDQWLGTDTNGGDGWAVTVSTAGFGTGAQTYFVYATDNEGFSGSVTAGAGTVGMEAILDEGGIFYGETGTGWSDMATGYLGGARRHAAGTGQNTARWTFEGLMAKPHDVLVSWPADSGLASDARYKIFDGETLLGVVTVDQRLQPSSAYEYGAWWLNLGHYVITSGRITIELSDAANGAVVADAVRVIDPLPTIESLIVSQSTVTRPNTFNLTAHNVHADSGRSIREVKFYRDRNGNAVLDSGDIDECLGTVTTGTTDWTLSNISTLGFRSGAQTYFAKAKDSAEQYSLVRYVIHTVTGPSVVGDATVNEGATYSLYLDPGELSGVTEWHIAWGDNSANTILTNWDGSQRIVTHEYGDDRATPYMICATAYNGTNHITNTLKVKVDNVVPNLSIQGEASVDEGSVYTLHLSADDPGDDTITGWDISWGDSATPQHVTGHPQTVTHVYADGNHDYTITATATDEDGTFMKGGTAGTLDSTFAGDGKFTTNLSPTFSQDQTIRAMAVQTDGKLVAVGGSSHLVRYLTNGNLDPDFADDGVVALSNFYASDVKIQADGKILVAGTVYSGSVGSIVVARYNTDGTADLSFGTAGQTCGISGTSGGMTLTEDGKIVVSGYMSTAFVVARFHANGSADASFGVGGKNAISVGGNTWYADVALQPDGKVVVVGNNYYDTEEYLVHIWAIRYDEDGYLDTAFGNMGSTRVVVNNDYGYCTDVAIQGDAEYWQILIAGTMGDFAGDLYAGIASLEADGAVNMWFGDRGVLTMNWGWESYANAIVVDEDMIYVAGTYEMGYGFVISRYYGDGYLDESFGDYGILYSEGGSSGGVLAIQRGGADMDLFVGGTADGDFAWMRYDETVNYWDTLIGSNGLVTTSLEGTVSIIGSGRAICLQGSNILVAGNSQGDYGLLRLDSNGRLDGLDGDGFIKIHINSNDAGNAVLVQSDGKIVVAGTSNNDFSLARYCSDGSPDNSFHFDGKVSLNLGSSESCQAVAIQQVSLPGGGTEERILVAGYVLNGTSGYDFALTRLEADGTVDEDFGEGGTIKTTFDVTSADYGYAVRLYHDENGAEKILVAGYSNYGYDMAIARYTANGQLDTVFGPNDTGKVTIPISGTQYNYSLAIQKFGDEERIVMAASAGPTVHLVRLHADGEVDETIGAGGVRSQNLGIPILELRGVAIQSDNKILVAGHVATNGMDFAVMRFHEDGALDLSFNGTGKLTTDFLPGYDRAYAMAVEPDGRIVVAGEAGGYFAVARYWPGQVGQKVSVKNVGPTLALSPAIPSSTPFGVDIIEGLNLADLCSFTDPSFSEAETYSYEIDWDYDGTTFVPSGPPETVTGVVDGSAGVSTHGTIGGSHVYSDLGSYTVAIRVSDGDGEPAMKTFDVIVGHKPTVQNPIGNVMNVYAGRASSTVDLEGAFGDVDSGHYAALSYTVTGVDGSNLIASTVIDQETDVLTLYYVPGAQGTAVVTVRATDPIGLYRETTVSVTVAGQQAGLELQWAPQGGSTVWDTHTANWTDGVNAYYWVPGAKAEFGGSGAEGTVTISGAVTAESLEFGGRDYRLSGGTLVISGRTVADEYVQVADHEVTIDSAINGLGRLDKRGAGALVLGGDNSYAGGTKIEDGALIAVKPTALPGHETAGKLEISSDLAKNPAVILGAPDWSLDAIESFFATHVGSLRNFGIDVAAGVTLTCPTDLDDFFGFIKRGEGRLILSGENGYTGVTHIKAGILEAMTPAALPSGGGGTLSVADGATLAVSATNWLSNWGPNIQSLLDNLTFTTGNLGIDVPVGEFYAYLDSPVNGANRGLVKLGAGKLTLAANNGYGGGTTVLEGTLRVGDAGYTTSSLGDGAVVNNGVLDLSYPAASGIGNAISGAGMVIVSGSGVVFTGTSTCNPTQIDGSLQIGNGGASGSITGDIYGEGSLTFDLVNGPAFSGQITESVEVTIPAGRTLKIGDDQSVIGYLDIAGTLDLNGHDLTVNHLLNTTGPGVVTSSSPADSLIKVGFDDTSAVEYTFAGTIQDGAGGANRVALEKICSNIFCLASSTNTYSGGTTVTGGTLQVGSDSSLGSVGSGAVVNNSALVFLATVMTIDNDISGSGSLRVRDSSRVIITGEVSCNTTLGTSSVLQIGVDGVDLGGGTSGSITGDITSLNGAKVVFSRADNLTYSGNIRGDVEVIKAGAGVLTFTGAENTYTSGTRIIEGQLQFVATIDEASEFTMQVPTYYGNVALRGDWTINWGDGSPTTTIYKDSVEHFATHPYVDDSNTSEPLLPDTLTSTTYQITATFQVDTDSAGDPVIAYPPLGPDHFRGLELHGYNDYATQFISSAQYVHKIVVAENDSIHRYDDVMVLFSAPDPVDSTFTYQGPATTWPCVAVSCQSIEPYDVYALFENGMLARLSSTGAYLDSVDTGLTALNRFSMIPYVNHSTNPPQTGVKVVGIPREQPFYDGCTPYPVGSYVQFTYIGVARVAFANTGFVDPTQYPLLEGQQRNPNQEPFCGFVATYGDYNAGETLFGYQNQRVELEFDGTRYVYFPVKCGNYPTADKFGNIEIYNIREMSYDLRIAVDYYHGDTTPRHYYIYWRAWRQDSAPQGSGGFQPISASDFGVSASVTVNDVAPTLELSDEVSGVVQVDESYTLTLGEILDPAEDGDVVTKYVIDWGDGTQTTRQSGDSGWVGIPDARDHTYTSVGQYTIRVSLWDEDGEHVDVASHEVTVTGFPISGTVFHDLNKNGEQDTMLLRDGTSEVVFVMDVSGSTDAPFRYGDQSITVREAEIESFRVLCSQLAATAPDTKISVVIFGADAFLLNMDPTGATAATYIIVGTDDAGDADEIPENMEEIYDRLVDWSILYAANENNFGPVTIAGTSYLAALSKVKELLIQRGTLPGEASVIFLSDGKPGIVGPQSTMESPEIGYERPADLLRNQMQVNLIAIGLGILDEDEDDYMPALQAIDPYAIRVKNAAELVGVIDGTIDKFAEPGLAGWKVWVDEDGDEVLDEGEPWKLTDEEGRFVFVDLNPGTHSVCVEERWEWLNTTMGSQPFVVPSPPDDTADFGKFLDISNRPPVFDFTPPEVVHFKDLEWSSYVFGQWADYDAYRGVFRLLAHATDPEGDFVRYDVIAPPAGLVVDPVTGWITFGDKRLGGDPTPPIAPRKYFLGVSARDEHGAAAAKYFEVEFRNDPPEFTGTDVIKYDVASGEPFDFTIDYINPEGSDTTFSVNDWVYVDGINDYHLGLAINGTNHLTWADEDIELGRHSITITAKTDNGLTRYPNYVSGIAVYPSTERTFYLDVYDSRTNSVPQIDAVPLNTTIFYGQTFYQQIKAHDTNNEPFTLSLTGPTGATMTGPTAEIPNLVYWKPQISDIGKTFTFTVTADDGHAKADGTVGSNKVAFAVTVAAWRAGNTTPTITPPEDFTTGLKVGESYAFRFSAMDPDGDAVEWKLSEEHPAGMTLSSAGLLKWTPGASDLGKLFPVTIYAEDWFGRTPYDVTFQVYNHDVQNDIYYFDVSCTRGDTDVTWPFPFKANPGQTLTFDVPAGAYFAGLSFDYSDGELSGDVEKSGTFTNQIVVHEGSDSITVEIRLHASEWPTTITSTEAMAVIAGTDYSYAFIADPPEGRTLKFSLLDPPAGMTIGETSGTIDWPSGQINTELDDTIVTVRIGVYASYSPNPVDTIDVPVPLYVMPSTFDNDPPEFTGELANPGETVSFPFGIGEEVFVDFSYYVEEDSPQGVTYYLVPPNLPEEFLQGLKIDQDEGILTWTNPPPGEHIVKIGVKDHWGGEADRYVRLVITDDETEPTVEIFPNKNPITVNELCVVHVVGHDDVSIRSVSLTLSYGTNTYDVELDSYGYGSFIWTDPNVLPVLRATAIDWAGNETETPTELTLRVLSSDTTLTPTIEIGADVGEKPFRGLVEIPVNVKSAGSELSYRLELIPQDSENPLAEPILLQAENGATSPMAFTILLDAGSFADGSYILHISATAMDGDTPYTNSLDRLILINSAERKSGNLDLSFSDLTISCPGFPIEIRRTYNSFAAAEADDFGYGWRMNYGDVELDVTHTSPGIDGHDYSWGDYTYAFTNQTEVWFQLPDGRELSFYFARSNNIATTMEEMTLDKPFFVQSAGDMKAYLTVEATAITFRNGCWYVNDGWEGYNPAAFGGYYLLTLEGLTYRINAKNGKIDYIRNSVGDRLVFHHATDSTTIKSQKYVSSADPEGVYPDTAYRFIAEVLVKRFGKLITEIVDPRENSVKYDYTAQGDLWRVTNRVGDRVEFEYLTADGSSTHLLSGIVDPRGITVLTAAYNEADNYRLESLTDVKGNASTFSYTVNSGKETEVVEDASGASVELVRDARGNVVRRIQLVDDNHTPNNPADDVYQVVFYEYDENGNQAKASFPYEPPAGKEHRFEAPPNLAANPGWRVQSTYDTNHNLLSTKDAVGNTTSYGGYDDYGNPGSVANAKGVGVRNTYDVEGRLVTSIDAAGQGTRYYYEAFSTEVYRFDANQILPNDILVSTMTYEQTDTNKIGLLISSIDHTLGATAGARYFDYDENCNRTLEWYNRSAQGQNIVIFTLTTYDAEDRVIATEQYEMITAGEEPGNVGAFNTVKGKAERAEAGYSITLVSRTAQVYNNLGQVTETEDTYGALSRTVYDVRGNVIESRQQVRNAAGAVVWQVTRTVYDDLGRQVFVTDPYLTATENDAGVATCGTKTVYDFLGRTIATLRYQNAVVDLVADDDPDYPAEANIKTSQLSGLVESRDVLSGTKTFYDKLGQVDHTVTLNNPFNTADDVRTDYYYDAAGRQVAVLGPKVTVAGYTVPVRLLTEYVLDQAGQQISVTTNLAVKDLSTEHPEVTTSTFRKNATKVDASAAQTTRYEYDSAGRQTAVIGPGLVDPADPQQTIHLRTQTVYDQQGRRVAVLENIQQIVKGTSSRLGSAPSRQTCYEYDSAGRLTAVILPAVAHPTLVDADGPLMVHPRYEYTYDQFGHQVSVRDNVFEVKGDYTVGGSMNETVNAPTTPVLIYYDHDGTAGDFSDAFDTRVTRFDYDVHGRQVGRTLPVGVSTAAPLDHDFEETKVYSDAPLAGHQTAESICSGQLEYEVDFEHRVTAYRYDNRTGSGGRLAGKYFYTSLEDYLADADDPGIEGVDREDLLGDAHGAIYYPAGYATYSYDDWGREHTVFEDGDGDPETETDQRATTNTYNDFGQLIEVSSEEGVIHYEYDLHTGNKIRTWTGTDTAHPTTDTRYHFDLLGRLDQVKLVARNGQNLAANEQEATDYVFDLMGNLDQVRLPNDVVSDYDYDVMNRLVKLTEFRDANEDHVFNAGDALLAQYDYTLNLDGKRSGVTELVDDDNNSVTPLKETRIDWFYDDLGRLTDEAYNSFDNSLDCIDQYKFDLVGNRREKASVKGTAGTPITDPEFAAFREGGALPAGDHGEQIDYVYDDNDRLLSERKDVDGLDNTADDRYTVYEYGTGNSGTQQTKKTVRRGLDANGSLAEETTYGYNNQGRMLQSEIKKYDTDGTTVTSTEMATYAYDADGIRVSQTEGGVETRHLYDKQNHTGYAQILEEKDVSGNVTKTYTLGLDVISQQAPGKDGGNTNYLLYDGHGSTRLLLNQDGQVVAGQIYSYDAFGNIVGFDPELALCTLRYSGEQTDNSGLQYLRSRYYQSLTASFTTMDSYRGNINEPQSLHKYLYCHGDGVNGIDPTGEYTRQEFGYLAEAAIEADYARDFPFPVFNVYYGAWTRLPGAFMARPDILNFTISEYNEIKPLSPMGVLEAEVQMNLRESQLDPLGFSPGLDWPSLIGFTFAGTEPILYFNWKGVIFYTDETERREEIEAALEIGIFCVDVVALLEVGAPSLVYGVSRIVAMVNMNNAVNAVRSLAKFTVFPAGGIGLAVQG